MQAGGRNDPCPCGSGRRYKHCHGTLAAAAPVRSKAEWASLGIQAHQAGRLDEAERCYREALALDPDYAIAIHYLGVALEQRGRPEKALTLLDRAVALDPTEPEFHNNRGLALYSAQRDQDAIAAHRRALELKPDHAGAWSNLGRALQAAGDLPEAIAALRRGLAIAPDMAALHWNLGLALLLLGEYAEGWREYEWRLRARDFAQSFPSYPGPLWEGQDPNGRTILVTAEQGLGDAIQFLRFAGPLAERGAKVLAMVPSALQALAATVPGVAAAYATGDPLPAYDFHVSLMSLPHRLGVTQADLGTVPYLHAAAAPVAREHGTLNVGIAWTGAPGNTLNARRSLPLAALAPLFDVPQARLYSLKREGELLTPADATYLPNVIELPLRNDFDGLAALVAALDLVISVDTSLAHLAGALGKPVWVLLSRVPDWRWGLERADSPWYPTARLFRQRVAGDWSAPVSEIVAAIGAGIRQAP